jgi:hypothetical protein
LLANDSAAAPLRLCDFPAVFLSYDEPWADRNWQDLKECLPGAVRVHGVKGLDACHKAAAEAVAGDWVVTVDADTRVLPGLAEAGVPRSLLTGNFRLDWLALNPVTGLWSGNGSVKLWPKALIREMRTHEVAPEHEVSLDHEIEAIRPGKSGQVTMPDRAAVSDPAETAFHAFRAGLREAVFLQVVAEETERRRRLAHKAGEADAERVLRVWCSIGRHALYGRWQIYGARLGRSLKELWPNWNPQLANDHDALREFWAGRVLPRFRRGRAQHEGEESWDWVLLEADLRTLAARIEAHGVPEFAEFDADASQLLAAENLMSAPVSSARVDSLGYKLMQAAKTADADRIAREVLELAAELDHPAAHDNLGRLHQRQPNDESGLARAAWHFRAAEKLGSPVAASHLAALEAGAEPPVPGLLVRLARDLPVVVAAQGGKAYLTRALRRVDGPVCLLLDKGVTVDPRAAAQLVPDERIVVAGLVVGYLGLCPVTGLLRPRGIRLGDPARLARAPDAAPDVFLPVMLGLLPEPMSAMEALRGGLADAGREIPPVLATLGCDAPFGGHWVLGSLLTQTGEEPSTKELKILAGLEEAALQDRIVAAAGRLSFALGTRVPVWSVDESRALKRLRSPAPERQRWLAAAQSLEGHGPIAAAKASVLRRTATAIWGGPAQAG